MLHLYEFYAHILHKISYCRFILTRRVTKLTEHLATIIIKSSHAFVAEYFKSFRILVENVDIGKQGNRYYIPENTSLCYQHPTSAPVNTTMAVFCDTPLLGNQIRIQLSNKKFQLVLCDVRVYGGKVSLNSISFLNICKNLSYDFELNFAVLCRDKIMTNGYILDCHSCHTH